MDYDYINSIESLTIIQAMIAYLQKREAKLKKKIKSPKVVTQGRLSKLRLKLMESSIEVFIRCAVKQMTRKTPIINIRQVSPPVQKDPFFKKAI